MINNKTDEVIKELFKSLTKKYEIEFKKSMRDNDFISDCVHLLYYKCHKADPNRGGSYIDSPDWVENRKAKVTPINKKR